MRALSNKQRQQRALRKNAALPPRSPAGLTVRVRVPPTRIRGQFDRPALFSVGKNTPSRSPTPLCQSVLPPSPGAGKTPGFAPRRLPR